MPRGILKTASSRDKALPEIPCFPALVEVNTKLNSFRSGNGLSNFYSKHGPASQALSSQRSRFGVNDSEDDILWTLTTDPGVVEPVYATQKGSYPKRRPPKRLPRSNCMRGNRYHSSMSSCASSIERRPRTHPRRTPGRRGYGSSTRSNAASRSSSRQLQSSYALHPTAARCYVEGLKPVTGLRLPKRKVRSDKATATPKASQLLPTNPSSSSRQKDCVGSSPLLLSSTKSNLRRRPRVDKRGSMSETDPGQDGLSGFLSTLSSPSLHQKRSTTGNLNTSYHFTDPDVTPMMGKRGSRRLSNAHKHIASPITIHSLPLILPAHAEYKCRVEWESDKCPQSDGDEAGNLWKKLEKECAISPTPHPPGHGLLHVEEGNFDELELTPRRGRWKVKVVKTPTIPSVVVPAERSPCEAAQSPFSEHTWADGDLKFPECPTDIDGDSVPILREMSITNLLPPLSAYAYLSSLMAKRISRHSHRARSRRSSTLASTRSKTRLSRTKKKQHMVHRDVKRALHGIWEDCEDRWVDEEQGGAALWNSHMAMLMSQSRSRRISNSSMGRGLSGNRHDRETSSHGWSPTNLGEGVTGLGITMNRSATLKSRTTTIGADSVIDFYLGT